VDIDKAKSFSKFVEKLPTHIKQKADIENIITRIKGDRLL
jgi:hypothetical protein